MIIFRYLGAPLDLQQFPKQPTMPSKIKENDLMPFKSWTSIVCIWLQLAKCVECSKTKTSHAEYQSVYCCRCLYQIVRSNRFSRNELQWRLSKWICFASCQQYQANAKPRCRAAECDLWFFVVNVILWLIMKDSGNGLPCWIRDFNRNIRRLSHHCWSKSVQQVERGSRLLWLMVQSLPWP